MYISKKISADFLYLALTMAFLRLGPQALMDQWQEPLDVGDIFLGSTLAYRQYQVPNMYTMSSHYINLKTVDTVVMNEVISVRDYLDYFRRSDLRGENVIAYYSDVPEVQISEDCSNQSSASETASTASSNNCSDRNDISREECPVQPVESFYNPVTLDLSPEDMDLIEILWKQDIDLGVSRDAFNSYESAETEKLKSGDEFFKDPKEFCVEETDLKKQEECDENTSFYSEWEGLCYTVDSETGEHIIKEQKPDDVQESIPQNQGLLFTEPSDQSLLVYEDFGDLSPSLFPSEECEDFNLTKVLIADEWSQSLNDPLFSDPELLAAQVEKFESLLSPDDNEFPEHEDETGNEMYPSMEEYWQDISNTLPLSVMGVPSHPSCLPVLPRPNRLFPEVSDDHATPSTSSDFSGRTETSDGYSLSLLHNVSFTQRAQEISSSFTYLPSVLGPTSLGCAVASSIATLTNDTDPVPDMGSAINGSYGLDLPSLLHTNHTAVTTANEALLSEMLLDEELQLMNVGGAAESEVACSSMSKIANDHMDLSSDDSANSSTSGNVSSMSDCNESRRTKFEELTCAEHSGKDALYATSKYSLSQPPMNLAYRHQADLSCHNQDYDFGVPSSYRSNYSHYLQHNHSYHLPFVNGNSSPKPITREKSRQSRYDEETNRDEKRAKALKLPITISDIINLAIDEFNEKLSKFELTEPQLTLIRDIRRRGKNKVAAQNCRKRKMDQITTLQQDLDLLHAERLELENDRTQLLHQRRNVRDKYSQLCQLVLQSTSHTTQVPDIFPSIQQNSSHAPTASTPTSDSCETEKDLVYQGVRTKQKLDKKKLDYP